MSEVASVVVGFGVFTIALWICLKVLLWAVDYD